MSTSSKQDYEFREALIPKSLLEDAIAWIAANLTPTDVFEKAVLEEWAEDNGYVIPTDAEGLDR
jgi:hypothetical protein